MTSEQILLQLHQEYARRREDNMILFEQRQDEACQRCPGLRELLSARHASVMAGVRATLLTARKDASRASGLASQMADMNRRITEKLKEGGLPENYLQPVYTCPACRDEGYIYDPSRRMCDCLKKAFNRRLLEESGLAGDAHTFESFDETLFSDEPDERGLSQRKAAVAIRNACLQYADSFPETPVRDLLLMGKSGLGKTFLLQCIAHRVAQRGFLPTYTSAYRLFELARKAYIENDSEILAPMMEAPLLLIDDLGTEPLMNNITVTQLFNLLNERQMAGRHTVISTNLTMSEMQERYTERITSRFLDATGCRRLLFIGGDIRRNLKRKADKA
ncbi:MAG: ATP-binding protein [Clostridia bacterium]|nr:ATP-binding protein [Clostridia bacterium]